MSGGVNAPGEMSLQDFMRLYAPAALPVVQPQASPLAALGQSQAPAQRQQGSGQGQGQGQQGSSLPFLGQLAQLGSSGPPPTGQAQPAPSGVQGLLINAMNANGANGNSNALANAVGFIPFGTGSFG